MARVCVLPHVFTLVDFEAAGIARLAAEVADGVGLPHDLDLVIAIDEANPFGGSSVAIEAKTVTVSVEGGAFENPKAIRQLSEAGTRLVLGRLLFRVRDRLDPAFGDPPPDPELTFAQHAAWDAYAVGRYAFRIRHGFSDAADRAFDRLWSASDLTWADIQAICQLT